MVATRNITMVDGQTKKEDRRKTERLTNPERATGSASPMVAMWDVTTPRGG
jgi:hypothetical protein